MAWGDPAPTARSRQGAPPETPAYREQTVEIALGLNGAFENGTIGTLTRRVPADRVLSAVPPPRRQLNPPREPRTPRAVELLRGQNHQHFLSMPEMVPRPTVTERALRPIAQLEYLTDRKAKFQELIQQGD